MCVFCLIDFAQIYFVCTRVPPKSIWWIKHSNRKCVLIRIDCEWVQSDVRSFVRLSGFSIDYYSNGTSIFIMKVPSPFIRSFILHAYQFIREYIEVKFIKIPIGNVSYRFCLKILSQFQKAIT